MPFFPRKGSAGSPMSPGSGKNVTFNTPISHESRSGSFSPIPEKYQMTPEKEEHHKRNRESFERLGHITRDRERARVLQRHLTQIPKNLFLNRVDLNVACCTWNVAETSGQGITSLEKWLQTKRGADLIAVGLQEVDMSARALATSNTGKADPWVDCLNRHAIPFNFKKLSSQSLVGQLLVVFVRSELFPEIEHLSSKEVKLGSGGFTGNKGALATSFYLHCKRFLFINSHFVPHTENTERRNENFNFVLNHLTKQDQPITTTSNCPCTNLIAFGTTGEVGQSRSIASVDKGFFGSPKAGQLATVSNSIMGTTDYIFWMGDLNYRVEGDYDDVMQAIAHKRIKAILSSDQLTKEKERGKVFQNFTESTITFLPTYKFLKNSEVYNTSKKGSKRRIPAYTDRVLYYKLKTPKADDFLPVDSNVIRSVKYKSYVNTVSDHHPVCCLLKVAVYEVMPMIIESVLDMGTSGMSPTQIAVKLSEQTNKPQDESSLWIQDHNGKVDPSICGPGTCYSSDEDRETVEQKQSKRLEDRLAAVESILTQGPLPGDQTLDKLKEGQTGLASRVEILASRLQDLPVTPHEEINLLGESMTHVLDKLHSVEGILGVPHQAEGPDEQLTKSVDILKKQFSQISSRMDLFITTVGAASNGGVLATDMIPLEYLDEPSLSEQERILRSEMRSIYLAGFTAGNLGSSKEDASFEEKMEERQSILARREEELRSMMSHREVECERREREVLMRENEVKNRSDTLEKLQKVLEDRIKAAESLSHTEATAADSLQRREEDVREQELRLLHQKARLSQQQLQFKSEIAELEAGRDTFTSQLHQREMFLGQRESQLNAAENKIGGIAYDSTPYNTTRSPSPMQAWKGVLEGPVTDKSPARLRGAYQDRSNSPLTELLRENNLYDTSNEVERQNSLSVSRYPFMKPERSLSPSPSPAPVRASSIPQSPILGRRPVDKVASLLAPFATDSRIPSNFSRIGAARFPDSFVYSFGSRQITIRPIGEVKKEARVLIGSGWMPFSDFVTKFGDSEQRRLIRKSGPT